MALSSSSLPKVWRHWHQLVITMIITIEVNFIKELLYVVDKEIAPETLEVLSANFKMYCIYIADGLYNTLNGL